MSNWDNKDFENRGADIARTYFAGQGQGGSDLTALVTKTARDNNLNPEQIKRLSRSANKNAFEQKFAFLEGHPDGRVAEFDVANEDAVISSLYKDAAIQTKTASAHYPDLHDERKQVANAQVFEKKASTPEENVEAIRRSLRVDRPDREFMRLEKAADELAVQEKRAEMVWEDNMSALAAATKGIYWNHDEFEKSAIALHGMDVVPELNALRSDKKLAALELTLDKIATIQDRVLASDTQWTKALKTASDNRTAFLQSKAARLTAQSRMNVLRETIRRGV